MSLYPELFGLNSQVEAIRWSFITVSVWWFIFLIPLAVTYKEPSAKVVENQGYQEFPLRI